MTGTRPRRLRRTAAVAVLACLLLTIPATAWAGDGNGRSGQRSERDGDGRADHRSERKADHNNSRRTDDDHERRAGRRDKGHRGGHDAVTQRDDRRKAKHERAQRHGRAVAKHRDRGPKIDVRIGKSDKRDGLVTSASVDLGNGDRERREETERGKRTRGRADDADARGTSRAREREEAERERQEAEARLRAAARELRAERFQDWLDGIGETRDPAPEPAVDPDTLEVEDPQPTVDEDETPAAALSTTAPPPPTSEPAAPTPAFQAPATDAAPSVAATPSADALAHEHGVIDRTFRAGGALLRDSGRAVIEALPPQTRTFGIPLGLLAALGGYLVAERRFRSGHLPMSAAAVPMQEGARERHRL